MHKLTQESFWGVIREQVIRRKFVQDVGTLTLANFAGAGLSFIQAILVARWLGPEQFGIAALVMSYPALMFTVLDARSRDATVKYLTQFSTKGETRQALAMCKLGYSVDLCIALVAFVLVGVTAWWAEASIVHTSGAASLMLVYALAFLPRALVGTSHAVLSVFGRFQTLAWMELLTTTFRVAAVLGLVLGGWGVTGVIWGSAAGMVVSGILLTISAYPLAHRTWGGERSFPFWNDLHGQRREIFRFLFFTDLSGLMALFVKQVDIVVLGYFRGPQEAGYYRLAKSLASVMTFLVSPLQTVTYQRMVSISNHPLKLREFTKGVALKIGAPFGLINLVGIFLLPWLALRFVGHSYLPSIPAIQLWVIAYSVWFTCFWVRPFYLASGWTKQWFYLSATGSLFFVITSVPLVTSWGFVGLTAARVSFPLVVNLGAVGLLLVMFPHVLKTKWYTKGGVGVSVENYGNKASKIIEVCNQGHAAFIASVISHEKLSQYFPEILEPVRNNVLTLEWVKGKSREKPTEEMMTRIAQFQASLHQCEINEHLSGFDYPSFIMQRVTANLHRVPPDYHGLVDKLMRVVASSQGNGRHAISSPDITPGNLIWNGESFKIVDVELLNTTKFYPIDLFSLFHAFDLKGPKAEAYIEGYKNAGGDVRIVRKLWAQLIALWFLRRIGTSASGGDEDRLRMILEDARISRGIPSRSLFRDLYEAINKCG